ncbi:MAG: type II toxin-antitoxin system RelE/ParE family toxin [Nitrospinae bacterium]|nr:type II toxin-antitoxin system RelE/ParE family toxin [Nitrospinota bacterium]
MESFRHRGLKRFLENDDPRRLPHDMLDRLRLILARLNTARNLEAMNVHSYHLHELKGNRKGIWSVTVRTNWRITFRFEGENAFDVNFEDYH